MRKLFLVSLLFLIFFIKSGIGASKRALSFDDLINCYRISDVDLSPDGKWIAFTLTQVDEKKNGYHSDIWLVSSDGKRLRQITTHESSSWSPRWSPGGKKLAFLSSRSGVSQVWVISMSGGEAYQLTDHYTGVKDFIWSNDGEKIAFVTRVYPDCPDQECNEKRDIEFENRGTSARVYDELLFRHWDRWWDYKRAHIFVLDVKSGEFKDVTPGDYDSPPIALGRGYVFSPDDQELLFTSNRDSVIAISTNNDVWAVNIETGGIRLISTGFTDRSGKGNDHSPKFSPDGRYISFLSMRRPGFESDKAEIFIKEVKTGKVKNLTGDIDLSVINYLWHPTGRKIIFDASHHGRRKIFELDVKQGKIKCLVSDGYNVLADMDKNGEKLIYLHCSMNRPCEIYEYSFKKRRSRRITNLNDKLFKDVGMNRPEDFWFEGADGDSVHGFILKPPFFDASKKYPCVFLVHGGPQGAWHDRWHYRWNAQVWAAQGYVIVMINPRGSTGYGQKFTDEISRDWGGKVFVDLVKGEEYVIDNFSFIDPERLAAAGASYGGYMINWIEGHMDRFKYPFRCLINHDGAFNLYSKYLTTEELWFPEWEFDGPYWVNKKYYKMWSPHNFVNNFSTPMLIIHGEKDFRLDYAEGIAAFTALRRRGIKARLILFPDEGHWVQKPKNSRFWHGEIFRWLREFIKK